jgi:hypothetical protein
MPHSVFNGQSYSRNGMEIGTKLRVQQGTYTVALEFTAKW